MTPALPVEVAATPADPLLERLIAPKEAGLETLRVLRTKVKAIGAERPFRVFGVVAATAHEGASSVALGLAITLAQEPGQRVLLVEADLDAPQVESSLGLESGPGLAERLEGGGDVMASIRRVSPYGVYVLPAGRRGPGSADLLASSTMARLAAELRAGFDFVVFDCPPLGQSADSVVLQGLLDGFLLVVRARHAPRETIRRALTRLRPEAIQGVVFNDRTEILAPRLDRRRGDR